MTEEGWSYRPALDGLRTVAIYLVLVFHAGWSHMSNGYIGVDVFFVLSGFLVTGIILREHSATGGLGLRRFYARRVRRLLPASVVLVVFTSLLSTLVLPRMVRMSLVADARAALLYVANWHFLGASTDYFAVDVQRSPFLHFWSLAVEEQFYFVFPLVLVGLLKLAQRWRRTPLVPVGLVALMIVSIAAQWWLARSNPLRAYYGTDTRLYQLLAGAVLASLRHRLRSANQQMSGVFAASGVVALCLLATDLVSMPVSLRGGLAVGLTVGIVAALEVAPSGLAYAALGAQPMTYLGRISYGTYLWHWPIIVLVGAGWSLTTLQMTLVAAVGATAAASVSFALLETPIRRSKRFDAHPRSVVAVGLSISLLAAVFVVPPMLQSARRPAFVATGPAVVVTPSGSGADAAALQDALEVEPPTSFDLAATEPPAFDYAACTPAALSKCVLHQGRTGSLRLHLIGDSNALVMVPVLQRLAEQYDFTFSVTATVGCPWQDGLEWSARDLQLVQQCIDARTQWYDEIIPALSPDVVVTVNVPRDPGSRPDAFYTADQATVAVATSESLDRLIAMGSRVIIMEPLPYDRKDPTTCLSGAATVGDCSYTANAAPFPTEVSYRRVADERAEVWVADADSLACPFLPVCVPMIDGKLVFRNQFHLSNQWVMDHADEWWQLLVGTGALSGWFERG